MRLNLAKHRRVYVPTGPYKNLIAQSLGYLRDGDTTTINITVTSETLAVVCELGSRYRLEELVYYRDAATTENIVIFGKQGPGDSFVWEELFGTYTADRVTVDLTLVLGHFKEIKVLHTVTVGTASVYELELWTDDNHVQFGIIGQTPVFSVDTGTNTLHPEPIQIYNAETVSTDAYCVIDSETTDAGGLSLGLASTGPFYGVYDLGISLPNDIPWANGSFNNTVDFAGNIILVSGTVGSYFTPVIDIDTVEGRRLFWAATLTGTNVIDDTTREDSVPTIGVRFSDTMPTDGGWATGQLSVDGLWSIVSGTLPFEPYDNNHVINPRYRRYMQAEIGFVSPVHGETPVLEQFGVEQGLKVVVPPMSSSSIYAKSQYSDHVPGRIAGVIVWSPEHRNKDQ